VPDGSRQPAGTTWTDCPVALQAPSRPPLSSSVSQFRLFPRVSRCAVVRFYRSKSGIDRITETQLWTLLSRLDSTVCTVCTVSTGLDSVPSGTQRGFSYLFTHTRHATWLKCVCVCVCRGVLHLPDHSYGIEPLDSAPGQHLLYRLQDVTSQPRGCGTLHHRAAQHTAEGAQGIEHRAHSRVRPHTLQLDVFLCFSAQFNYMRRNETAVTEDMIHLASYIDSIYVHMNVRVVLVGLEIWTQQNRISTDGAVGEVLSRFTQWRERELLQRRRHDSAQLILKKSFGGTAGMAFVSTVCSRSHGGGINTFVNNNVQALASVVAHELGHNLGMNHDDGRDCSCPERACIMNATATGSRSFSSCSADDFEKMLLLTGGSCLLNVPRPDEAFSAPACGNRLVDAGEDCDCGTQKECEDDPCCEFQTCRLKPGARCAFGECCYKCQFLPGGSVCRSSTDECDLPEFCNGSSPFCQSDVFVQDGQPCRNRQAFCYGGRCQHHDGQCQAIFGARSKAAPEICFKDINRMGDRFGNCGNQNYGYKKCESRNALCGKLQCSNIQKVTVFSIQPSIISTSIGDVQCYGVDFMLGSDVPDPGMVRDGTKTGKRSHKARRSMFCYPCGDIWPQQG
uniref:ADAM metallopeptidase domain 9 n=1 Tax=Salarias fasciatus TaxID=181472 RepID=A0A672HFP2_SALFA